MLLFLDFDGVLRRTTAPLYALEPDLVRRLERLLREHSSVRVVITSSWREAFTLAEMRAPFSEDIRCRILGATPIAPDRIGHFRHREVQAYLRRRAPTEPWVALDDDPEHYPPGAPVVLTDPSRGFDDATADALRARLLGTD